MVPGCFQDFRRSSRTLTRSSILCQSSTGSICRIQIFPKMTARSGTSALASGSNLDVLLPPWQRWLQISRTSLGEIPRAASREGAGRDPSGREGPASGNCSLPALLPRRKTPDLLEQLPQLRSAGEQPLRPSLSTAARAGEANSLRGSRPRDLPGRGVSGEAPDRPKIQGALACGLPPEIGARSSGSFQPLAYSCRRLDGDQLRTSSQSPTLVQGDLCCLSGHPGPSLSFLDVRRGALPGLVRAGQTLDTSASRVTPVARSSRSPALA